MLSFWLLAISAIARKQRECPSLETQLSNTQYLGQYGTVKVQFVLLRRKWRATRLGDYKTRPCPNSAVSMEASTYYTLGTDPHPPSHCLEQSIPPSLHLSLSPAVHSPPSLSLSLSLNLSLSQVSKSVSAWAPSRVCEFALCFGAFCE